MLYVWAHWTDLVECVHYHPYAQAPSFLPGSGGCVLDAAVEQSSWEAEEIEVIS